MKGAILYKTKYGSTKQYANWIAEATGLPIFNVSKDKINFSIYDFFVLGSPVIYYKLSIYDWVKDHFNKLEHKPVIFFSVSGAGAGDKLMGWLTDSFPQRFISKMFHVALRGRQIPSELTFFDRMMLQISGHFNKDDGARQEELHGFDYMDKNSIQPILAKIKELESTSIDML